MDHQAFAQLLGSYGEFVGAIAVVVTLIYLSIQVRGTAEQVQESRNLTQVQMQQSNMDNFNVWRKLAVEGKNASIWFRGINDLDALDEDEKYKFFFMAAAFDWACWFLFQQQTDKGEMVDVNEHLYRDQFRHPGYRKWMTAMRPHHSDEYGEFLDKVAESVGDEVVAVGQFSSLSIGEF